MKKIEAVIRPEKLEPLKDELLKKKINGLTINQVLGCGNQLGYLNEGKGNGIILNTLSKVEIKIVVPDERLDEIVNTIIDISETGEYGDGKIFISDVMDCVRIRTKEHGVEAL